MFRRLIAHFMSNLLAGSLCSASIGLAVSFLSMTAAGHVQADVVASSSAAVELQTAQEHGFFFTDGPASSAGGPNLQTTRAISASAKVENPLLRSGLALAGANLHRSSGDDGILTALEASGLNLWGTTFCWASFIQSGEWATLDGKR